LDGSIHADGFAVDEEMVADDGGIVRNFGIAALVRDCGISVGTQCIAVVHDANFQLGNRLGLVAVDGNVFVVGPPVDRIGLAAPVTEDVLAIVVKDAVDRVGGSPGLVESDGHCGRVLVKNPDGLSEVDLGKTIGFEDGDVLGTRRGEQRRRAGWRGSRGNAWLWGWHITRCG